MNHDDSLSAISPDPRRVVVDDLLDGEGVEKEVLRDALDHADTRNYFIDMLVLRRIAIDMGPNTFHDPGRPRTAVVRGVRWMAAAVVLVTTAMGGYMVGRDGSPTESAGAPLAPAPAAEVFEPGSAAEAPAPTSTFRFERGRNWISNLEEN